MRIFNVYWWFTQFLWHKEKVNFKIASKIQDVKSVSRVVCKKEVNAIWAYPKFLQFSMLFQHWRKWVGTRLPSETQQMREWTNEWKQTNRIHNAFCLHYGQRSIVSHHLIRPQTWWEVMDIESNELATVEDTGRGFAPSTQHIHLRFGVSLVRHLYENQEEFPGMLTGWFVEYLCQAEMEDSSRPGHSHSHRSFNSTVRAAINSIAPSFDNEPAPTHPIELAHLELSIFLSWLKAVERDFICTTHDNIITVTTEDYGTIRLSEEVYNYLRRCLDTGVMTCVLICWWKRRQSGMFLWRGFNMSTSDLWRRITSWTTLFTLMK